LKYGHDQYAYNQASDRDCQQARHILILPRPELTSLASKPEVCPHHLYRLFGRLHMELDSPEILFIFAFDELLELA
jgi:hypothetical protein